MFQVMEIDDNDFLVRFMKRVGVGSYIWPDNDDISWQDLSTIIAKVDPPVLKNNRGHFEFSSVDIDRIKNMLTSADFD